MNNLDQPNWWLRSREVRAERCRECGDILLGTERGRITCSPCTSTIDGAQRVLAACLAPAKE